MAPFLPLLGMVVAIIVVNLRKKTSLEERKLAHALGSTNVITSLPLIEPQTLRV